MSGRSHPPRKWSRELSLLRKQFTSLEAMAEALRVHEGFEDLNRSTLVRWMRNPTARTPRAVELLASRLDTIGLRIGETRTLSVIPNSMLLWEPKAGTPYGALARRYRIEPEVHPTSHGKDGLEILVSGQADLVVVPGDLLHWFPPYCARLCRMARMYIAGISTRLVDSTFDLKGIRFGILSGSSFGTRLRYESRNWGFELPAPMELPSLEASVQALVEGRIHGIAGWEPFVSHARRAAGRRMTLYSIPQGLLGWFELHVAVNLKTAHPGAVRAYLTSLSSAVRFTNARKTVSTFHSELARKYAMSPAEVRQVLTNILFGVDDLDSDTVLKLWERETVRTAAVRGPARRTADPR